MHVTTTRKRQDKSCFHGNQEVAAALLPYCSGRCFKRFQTVLGLLLYTDQPKLRPDQHCKLKKKITTNTKRKKNLSQFMMFQHQWKSRETAREAQSKQLRPTATYQLENASSDFHRFISSVLWETLILQHYSCPPGMNSLDRLFHVLSRQA